VAETVVEANHLSQDISVSYDDVYDAWSPSPDPSPTAFSNHVLDCAVWLYSERPQSEVQ